MQRVLAMLRNGYSVRDAMDAVERKHATYYDWRAQDTLFKRRADEAIELYESETKAAAEAKEAMLQGEERLGLHSGNDVILLSDYDSWVDYVIDFRWRYFGRRTFPHIRRMYECMERAGEGSITMILIFPEAGKTAALEDYAIAMLCADPNLRLAYISESRELGETVLRAMKERMTEDEHGDNTLLEHFGPFRDTRPGNVRPWNMTMIGLALARHQERDPSFLAVGMGGAIRGRRWDTVMLDDVQSDRSMSETQKFVRLFRGDILTRPGQFGRIIIIGSRIDRDDFYETLLKQEGLVDELYCIPALDLSKPVGQQSVFPPQMDESGHAIVNDRGEPMGWSDEAFAKRREKVGPDHWMRVYMQKPESAEGGHVTEDDIEEATNRARRPGEGCGVGTIATIDLAIAGHAALQVHDYDAEKLYVRDVIDIERPRRYEPIFDQLEMICKKRNPGYVVVEKKDRKSVV